MKVEILTFEGCRTYMVAGEPVGVPPEKWLVDALARGIRSGPGR